MLWLALVLSTGLATGRAWANEHTESSVGHGEAAAKDAPAGLPEPPPQPKEVIEPVVQGLRPALMPAQSRSRMTSKPSTDDTPQGTGKPFDAAGLGWATPYPLPVTPREEMAPSRNAVVARRCLAWGFDDLVRDSVRQSVAALLGELTDRPSLKVRDVATPIAWVRRAAAPPAEAEEAESESGLSTAQSSQGTNAAPGPILLPGRWGEGSAAASGEPPVSSYNIQATLLPSSTTRRPVKVAKPVPPPSPIPTKAPPPKASPAPPAPLPEETDQSILSALQKAIRDMGVGGQLQVPQPQPGSEHLNFETPGASALQSPPVKRH